MSGRPRGRPRGRGRQSPPPQPPPPPPPASPCAACRHLRECEPNCLMAPYFPPSLADEFDDVCRYFGRDVIVKTIRTSEPKHRFGAVQSLIDQARMITRLGKEAFEDSKAIGSSSGYGTSPYDIAIAELGTGWGRPSQEMEPRRVLGSSSRIDVCTELRLGIGSGSPSQEMEAQRLIQEMDARGSNRASSSKDATSGFGSSSGSNRGN